MKLYFNATKVESAKRITLIKVYLNGEKIDEGIMQRAQLNVMEIPFKGEELTVKLDVIKKKNAKNYRLLEIDEFKSLEEYGEDEAYISEKFKENLKSYMKKTYEYDEEIIANLVSSEDVTDVPAIKDINGVEKDSLFKRYIYLYKTIISNMDPNKKCLIFDVDDKKYFKNVPFALPVNIKDEEVLYKKVMSKIEKIIRILIHSLQPFTCAFLLVLMADYADIIKYDVLNYDPSKVPEVVDSLVFIIEMGLIVALIIFGIISFLSLPAVLGKLKYQDSFTYFGPKTEAELADESFEKVQAKIDKDVEKLKDSY